MERLALSDSEGIENSRKSNHSSNPSAGGRNQAARGWTLGHRGAVWNWCAGYH